MTANASPMGKLATYWPIAVLAAILVLGLAGLWFASTLVTAPNPRSVEAGFPLAFISTSAAHVGTLTLLGVTDHGTPWRYRVAILVPAALFAVLVLLAGFGAVGAALVLAGYVMLCVAVVHEVCRLAPPSDSPTEPRQS